MEETIPIMLDTILNLLAKRFLKYITNILGQFLRNLLNVRLLHTLKN